MTGLRLINFGIGVILSVTNTREWIEDDPEFSEGEEGISYVRNTLECRPVAPAGSLDRHNASKDQDDFDE